MRNWEKLFRLLVVVTLSKFALLGQKFDLCLLFVLCGCSLHFPSFSILSLYTPTFPLFYSFLFPPFPLFSFSPPPCFPIPALFSSPPLHLFPSLSFFILPSFPSLAPLPSVLCSVADRSALRLILCSWGDERLCLCPVIYVLMKPIYHLAILAPT